MQITMTHSIGNYSNYLYLSKVLRYSDNNPNRTTFISRYLNNIAWYALSHPFIDSICLLILFIFANLFNGLRHLKLTFFPDSFYSFKKLRTLFSSLNFIQVRCHSRELEIAVLIFSEKETKKWSTILRGYLVFIPCLGRCVIFVLAIEFLMEHRLFGVDTF